VELSIADFIAIAVLVGAGCALSFAGLWIMLRQAASVSQQATESQLDALAGALKALEAKVAELSKIPESQAVAAPEVEVEAPVAAAPQAVQREDEEVTAETLAVIAAAVTAYLGKKVRIRSAKAMRPPREVASAWSQHGRLLVHGSHNPRSRS
jgi:hypothetical protein